MSPQDCLRITVFAFLAAAAGCAQRPVRSSVAASTVAAATPTQAALQAVPLDVLRKARDHGYEPEFWYCPGPGSSGTCVEHCHPGWTLTLLFCRQETPTGTLMSTTNCVDAPHLSLRLQQEDSRSGVPDATFH